MTAKYRADHIGSLLRPQQLLDARTGGVEGSTLRDMEIHSIRAALAKQAEAGLRIFTDGEFRRRTFMSDFNDSVEGLDEESSLPRDWHGSGDAPKVSRVAGVVTAKLRQVRRLTAREVPFLKANSPGDIKVTLPSANQFPAIAFEKGVSEQAYPTIRRCSGTSCRSSRAEIQALVAEGVQYIQIDAPRYSYYIDPKWRELHPDEMGIDPEEALDEAIRADNACLEGATARGRDACIHLAAATTAASGTPKAATIRSPSSSSAS